MERLINGITSIPFCLGMHEGIKRLLQDLPTGGHSDSETGKKDNSRVRLIEKISNSRLRPKSYKAVKQSKHSAKIN